MNVSEVLAELKGMANEGNRKVQEKHGAPGTHLGVKVEDLKKIQKKIKKDYQLSMELYQTGNPDAQYLAGLIADENQMTKEDLQNWVKNATWQMISEYTVAWIAAESRFGWELALKWIKNENENIQSSGWNTLASLISIKKNEELNMEELKKLMKEVGHKIHNAGNRVKYTMNSFLIAVGGYIPELTQEAIHVAKEVGTVTVDMGGTACKVPSASDYIQKMVARAPKKKKMARC